MLRRLVSPTDDEELNRVKPILTRLFEENKLYKKAKCLEAKLIERNVGYQLRGVWLRGTFYTLKDGEVFALEDHSYNPTVDVFKRILVEERDKLIEKMNKEGFHRHVNGKEVQLHKGATARDINHGWCDMYAQAVENRVPNACDDITDFDTEPGHFLVLFRGRCYDAECIEGVDDYHELPIMRRDRAEKLRYLKLCGDEGGNDVRFILATTRELTMGELSKMTKKVHRFKTKNADWNYDDVLGLFMQYASEKGILATDAVQMYGAYLMG
jgi:hypothetical protein